MAGNLRLGSAPFIIQDDIIPRRGFGAILTPKAEIKKGAIANPLKSLVGDAGFEPTAFGSGDQRSIHLS